MVIRRRASLSGGGYASIDFPTLAVECRARLLERRGLEQLGQLRRGANADAWQMWWRANAVSTSARVRSGGCRVARKEGAGRRRVKILRSVVSRAEADASRGRIRLSPLAQPHSDAPVLILLDEDDPARRARTATCARRTSLRLAAGVSLGWLRRTSCYSHRSPRCRSTRTPDWAYRAAVSRSRPNVGRVGSGDRKGCQLRLGREPAFDDCQMWIELRGHADPRLVFSLGASVHAARLAGFD